MPAKPALKTFANPASLALQAAKDLIQKISSMLPRQEGFSLALSGGRISQSFYKALVEESGRSLPAPAWGKVDFFWADERCVVPTDAESNYRTAAEFLLDPLGIDAVRRHRILGELSPEKAALEAERDIVAHFDGKLPVIDLVVLGMGEDGHVASLFPGEAPEPRESATTYRWVTAVKPPPLRVTLTYAAIERAREVWVLASGKGKEAALRQSLETDSTPLGLVRECRESMVIYTDVELGRG